MIRGAIKESYSANPGIGLRMGAALRVFGLLPALLLLPACGPPDAAPVAPSGSPGPPGAESRLRRALGQASVLLVVLDAAGARHFGCYGHVRPTTPEIDRLAAE